MISRSAQIIRLAKPFWLNSEARRLAWLLLAVLLVLVAANTGLMAWNTQLTKGFYDALQNRDAAAFNANLVLLFVAIAFIVAVAVNPEFFNGYIGISHTRWASHGVGHRAGSRRKKRGCCRGPPGPRAR